MRLTVIGLVLLGIVAAGAAAVLVAVFRFSPETQVVEVEKEPETVEIAVAAREMQPFQTVEQGDVESMSIRKDELGEMMIVGGMNVVGETLKHRMVAGEPFKKNSFVPRRLELPIPNGFTAHVIPLSNPQISHILHPGCLVDISGRFKNLTRVDEGLTVIPLMPAVKVLTVGTETIMDEPGESEGTRSASRAQSANWLTVLVTPKEALRLNFAASLGELTVDLRPKPGIGETADLTGMTEDRFSDEALSQLIRIQEVETEEQLAHALQDETAAQEPEEPTEETAPARVVPRGRSVDVIRGTTRQTIELEAEETSGQLVRDGAEMSPATDSGTGNSESSGTQGSN